MRNRADGYESEGNSEHVRQTEIDYDVSPLSVRTDISSMTLFMLA